MKLRGKLLLGFAVIIVLNILIAGVVYNDVDGTTSNVEEIVGKSNDVAQDIKELQAKFSTMNENNDRVLALMEETGINQGAISGNPIEIMSADMPSVVGALLSTLDQYYMVTREADMSLVEIEEALDENFVALGDETSSMASSNRRLILIVNAIAVLVAVVVILALSKIITLPIQRLTAAANEIGEGNIDARIPEIKTKDEVKDMADAIETMTGAIRFLKNKQSSE